ncbi:hypothetical protein VrSk94_14660 [Vibrio rotiferianus]
MKICKRQNKAMAVPTNKKQFSSHSSNTLVNRKRLQQKVELEPYMYMSSLLTQIEWEDEQMREEDED